MARSLNLPAKLVAALVVALLLVGVVPTAAFAATASPVFTGGVTHAGVQYAKNGTALTLTVTTSSDTKCVELSTGAKQGQATAKTSWVFPITAGSGDGVQSVTATAYPTYNSGNQNCSGSSGAGTASYTLDN